MSDQEKNKRMTQTLFILSGNISTTPRARKVAEYIAKNQIVKILGINRTKVWASLDTDFEHKTGIKTNTIDISKRNFGLWFLAGVMHKLSKFCYKFFPNNLSICAFASEKTSIYLYFNLFFKPKPDRVIAFSYGSLFPAYFFARKHAIPFIIDIEDYYPGEGRSKAEQNRREFLMKKILPVANFITYASPLIGEYSLKLVPNFPAEKHVLVNNCFSGKEFWFQEINSDKVEFVWFSQTIGEGRGLELALPALAKFNKKVKLTLIGNLNNAAYREYISSFGSFVEIIPPLIQTELNSKLSEYDVGLAMEVSSSDLNKDIALSNKIFAYLQAGLFVLATNTKAQKLFMEQMPEHGVICNQSVESFADEIEKIINTIETIRAEKYNRFNKAKSIAWETVDLSFLINHIDT